MSKLAVLKVSESGKQEIKCPCFEGCSLVLPVNADVGLDPTHDCPKRFPLLCVPFAFAIGKAGTQLCFPRSGGLGAALPPSCAFSRPLPYQHLSY